MKKNPTSQVKAFHSMWISLLSFSFKNVMIEFFSKYVHFTLARIKLMIECLQYGLVPIINEILEANASFRLFSKCHEHIIATNDVFHAIYHGQKTSHKYGVDRL